MRIFIVVAKHRLDLFQYFSTGFSGVDGVEVILDRRLGEAAAGSTEHPRGDKRHIPSDIYDELEERGFVIVRLPI